MFNFLSAKFDPVPCRRRTLASACLLFISGEATKAVEVEAIGLAGTRIAAPGGDDLEAQFTTSFWPHNADPDTFFVLFDSI